MEANEVTEVAVMSEGIDISEELHPNSDDSVHAVYTSTEQTASNDQVFTTTPTAILTAEGLQVHEGHPALKTTHIVTVVQDNNTVATVALDTLKAPQTPQTPITPATPATPYSGKDKPSKYNWDDSVHLPILPVRCRNQSAELHKCKLGSGGRGRCIKMGDTWYTPTEFESYCGRGNSKDWKRSIRYGGRTLQCLIEEGILQPHATSCTCAACCDDEAVVSTSGPVRLFVPYKRRKRGESESGSTPPRKTARSASVKTKERSFSVDERNGEITVTENSNAVLPPMTPATPKPSETEQSWWHLEEMANSLIQQAQQLKAMIEQAKAQAQAAKDAAVAQAKLQYETEKKEALTQSRLEAQMQLSRALMEARAEKDSAVAQALAQARADKLEAVEQAKSEQLIKTCVNCGREALSECTGCHRVSYCSSFCQRKDWATHQNSCGQNSASGSPSPMTTTIVSDAGEPPEEDEEDEVVGDADKDDE
ncbi:deformed epidermal autoregulatory factor 1 homolog isoform X2 [Ptychodera flava]|uniref:deformed epidermal autoregulatory factor 1 homolog isoform X2 n=1 Tax=Ptychodera flava TaxID=63121 RepID=UPI00396A458C